MGVFDFFWRWLGWGGQSASSGKKSSRSVSGDADPRRTRKRFHRRPAHPQLEAFRFRGPRRPPRKPRPLTFVKTPAYFFSQADGVGRFYDFTGDTAPEKLAQFGLPVFSTPQELADWLQIPIGRLAWLVHRTESGQRSATRADTHYHHRWLKKRSGGLRLIEAPKPLLKFVQHKILAEILNQVPLHSACHGFTAGRSIVTNALPHLQQRVIIKLDLRNFYTTVSYPRVVAIYRSLGYCREAALWLAKLTTSNWPSREQFPPEVDRQTKVLLNRRHLPQGAPTSPALANLSAFALDLRLAGLARSFGAKFTRYADDLTFSGPGRLLPSLNVFLPLVYKIIRHERFYVHPRKFRVIRDNQRQLVTGVVVNQQPNVARPDFDRLKAILTNCIRKGPSTQNHAQHPEFRSHLLGRIGHVRQLNPARGEKLLALYRQIDWNT